MTFNLHIQALGPHKSTLQLEGRLDAMTFGEFDREAEKVLQQMETGSTLVLDLSSLQYISSAGLRSIAKARKHMRARRPHAAAQSAGAGAQGVRYRQSGADQGNLPEHAGAG